MAEINTGDYIDTLVVLHQISLQGVLAHALGLDSTRLVGSPNRPIGILHGTISLSFVIRTRGFRHGIAFSHIV